MAKYDPMQTLPGGADICYRLKEEKADKLKFMLDQTDSGGAEHAMGMVGFSDGHLEETTVYKGNEFEIAGHVTEDIRAEMLNIAGNKDIQNLETIFIHTHPPGFPRQSLADVVAIAEDEVDNMGFDSNVVVAQMQDHVSIRGIQKKKELKRTDAFGIGNTANEAQSQYETSGLSEDEALNMVLREMKGLFSMCSMKVKVW